MSYKLIISADDVIARMALTNHQEVVDTIEATLPAAHAYFQGLLDTGFEPASKTDLFHLDTTHRAVDGYYRLRLGQAFVDTTLTFTVTSGDTDRSTPDEMADTVYRLQAAKGILFVPVDYTDKWVSVTYTAGFSATNRAPDWLKEAVLCYMPDALDTSEPTNRNDEKAKISEATEVRIRKIIDPHLRGTAFHIRPAFA